MELEDPPQHAHRPTPPTTTTETTANQTGDPPPDPPPPTAPDGPAFQTGQNTIHTLNTPLQKTPDTKTHAPPDLHNPNHSQVPLPLTQKNHTPTRKIKQTPHKQTKQTPHPAKLI